MKLSLSSLAIVGIAASTLPNAAGHLRSIPPPSLVEEDNAHSYGKGATAPLTKGTEEASHERLLRRNLKSPKKKGKKDKKKNKKVAELQAQLDESRKEVADLKAKLAIADSLKAKAKESEKTAAEKYAALQEKLNKSQAETEESQKVAKEAAEKSQEELKQSRDEAKKAAGELKANSEECEQLQAEAAARLQGLQSNVCGVITQVESERTKAAAVEKEVAENAKQAYDTMEAAMKEMSLSCVPEAPETEELTNSNIPEAKQVDASQKQEVFGLTKLDQQQDAKQNELEEKLKAAKDAVYVPKNAAEEQYVQISALANRANALEGNVIASKEQLSQTEAYTSNISKAQTEVKQVNASQKLTDKNQELTATAQFADPKVNFRDTCSEATQKFMELAQVYMSANTNSGSVSAIALDVNYREKIGKDQELIGLTGKDKVDDIDLSSLASIVECRNVREQQSYVKAVEGSYGQVQQIKQFLPYVSDEDTLKEIEIAKAKVDTDTYGN